MDWIWFGLSLIGGIAVVLADLFRAERKTGRPWLTGASRIALALWTLCGAVAGWLAFYKVPPVLYRGGIALFDALNDPDVSLYRFVPLSLGMLFGIGLGYASRRAWRKSVEAKEAGLRTEAAWHYLLSASVCMMAAVSVVAGFYITAALR